MSFLVHRSAVSKLPNEFQMEISHHEDPHGTIHTLGTVRRTIFGMRDR